MIPEGEESGKCRICGKCCYLKLKTEIGAIITNVPCPFLNEDTKKCKVFDKRFDIFKECLTTRQAKEQSALPSDCPYVKEVKDYEAPLTWEEAQDKIKKIIGWGKAKLEIYKDFGF